VSESISQLITACAVSAAPGQKECDAAVRQIEVNATPYSMKNQTPVTLSDNFNKSCPLLPSMKNHHLISLTVDVSGSCTEDSSCRHGLFHHGCQGFSSFS